MNGYNRESTESGRLDTKGYGISKDKCGRRRLFWLQDSNEERNRERSKRYMGNSQYSCGFHLGRATLDWKTDMFQPTFNFSVKNTSSCGCGSSFQFN